MSAIGDTATRVALGTLVGGGAALYFIERARAHDTVKGRQETVKRVRGRPDVPGLGDSGADGSAQSNAGLGVWLGPPPGGSGWDTATVRTAGLRLPVKVIVGAGAGRQVVPAGGSLADWIETASGAHVASIVDKAIRGSPPAGTNTQAQRAADLAQLAGEDKVDGAPRLADLLRQGGYGNKLGATLLVPSPGTPATLTLRGRVSGRTRTIDVVTWVNGATHKRVQALIADLTAGDPDFAKRQALMTELQTRSNVPGFPELRAALSAHGFLTDPLKMTPLGPGEDKPITLGRLAPVQLGTLVNTATTYETLRPVVTAAEKSDPAPTVDKAKAAALAALKALEAHIDAQGVKGFSIPGDMHDVIAALELVAWTNVAPDASKYPQVSTGPKALRYFQEVPIPNLRAWVSTASAGDVNAAITALTDKTSATYQRYLLTQIIQSDELVGGPWEFYGTTFPDWPPLFADWLVGAGWLRPTLEPWAAVKAAATESDIKAGTPLDWSRTSADGTRFDAGWVWSWPPTQGRSTVANLLSLFEGPVQSGAIAGSGGPGWVASWPAMATAYAAAKKRIGAQV